MQSNRKPFLISPLLEQQSFLVWKTLLMVPSEFERSQVNCIWPCSDIMDTFRSEMKRVHSIGKKSRYSANWPIKCLLLESKQNLSATSEHGLYIEPKKLLLIHFASISTSLKKQMVAILLSRLPSYGCALIILQTCIICFAICLVTSWKKYLNYSEKEPSECYIILSRHSKILVP